MDNAYLTEAFKELNLLNEEAFDVDEEGIDDFKELISSEDEDVIDIIDDEAETEEELEDSYVGKVVLDCCVCHSKIYKDADSVVIDEGADLANVGDECPYCYSVTGYKILGQITPFKEDSELKVEIEDKDGDGEIEDDEGEVKEEKKSKKESLSKKSRKSLKEEFEIYFDDLTPEAQQEFLTYIGGEENLNAVWPIAISYDEGEEIIESKECSKWKKKAEKPVLEDKQLQEKNWKTTIKAGAALRNAIEAEDYQGILDGIKACYQEMLDKGIIDDWDFEQWTEDFDYLDLEDEDIEDTLDYELSNLYDACDNLGCWIELSESLKKKGVKENLEKVELETEDSIIKVSEEEKEEDLSEPDFTDFSSIDFGDEESTEEEPAKEESEEVSEDEKELVEESFQKKSGKRLQEKSVGVKNFLSDIGKIVYALDWYAGNISTNLENDKYAAHFDSPERLGKAAQVSAKALGRLGALMSQKMGYDINGGGNFLDTSITKKPSAMSERIADLRNLLAEHSSGILVNAPDPRVKNNNNLKNEVSELLKGLRSSLGTLASEVSKVKQGETKGLFNKKFKESFESVELETEDKVIKVTEEPKEEVPEAEMIEPLDTETKKDIVDASTEEDEMEDISFDDEESGDTLVDQDFEEFDEEEFNDLGESYLKRVYDNVRSFKTSKVSTKGNTLKLEGIITFNSGNRKATTFLFEAKDITKRGRVRFVGENCQISRGKKSFTLTGKVSGKKLIAESLNYNYRAKDNTGKSVRLYGTIKKNLQEAAKKDLPEKKGTIANALKNNMERLSGIEDLPTLKKEVTDIIKDPSIKDKAAVQKLTQILNSKINRNSLLATLGTYMTGQKGA